MSDEKPKQIQVSATAAVEGTSEALAVSLVRGPLPDDDPFYAKIGRVAAECARLEHILDTIIWYLSGQDQPATSCITGQLVGPRPRLTAIESLCEIRSIPSDLINKAKSYEDALAKISLRRNRFLHDAWFIEYGTTDKKGQFKSHTYKKHTFGFEEITDDYTNETIELIKNQADELLRLRVLLFFELPPSPDKQTR
jgi:hypothetical protein